MLELAFFQELFACLFGSGCGGGCCFGRGTVLVVWRRALCTSNKQPCTFASHARRACTICAHRTYICMCFVFCVVVRGQVTMYVPTWIAFCFSAFVAGLARAMLSAGLCCQVAAWVLHVGR